MQTLVFATRRIKRHLVWLVLGIFTSAVTATVPAPASTQTYSDIPDHWVQPCVQQLTEAGIVNGYPDGTFRPEQEVTRAEYAALLSQAFPEIDSVRDAIDFRDVTPSDWGYEAIQTVYRKGFLSGYPNREFRPTHLIKRADAFVALASGLNFVAPSDPQSLLESTFVDTPTIPPYATEALAASTDQGVLIRRSPLAAGALMRPSVPATRAQVAAALCQVKFEDSSVPSAYVVAPGSITDTEDLAVRLGGPCTNPVAGYSVQYPQGWRTNNGHISEPCRYFDPEELTLPERAETFDEAISLRTDSIPYDRIADSNDITQEILSRRETTIDEQPALITEAETTGRGILPSGIRNYTYVVDLNDSIFVGATYDVEGQQYLRNKQVLDLMMASLSFSLEASHHSETTQQVIHSPKGLISSSARHQFFLSRSDDDV